MPDIDRNALIENHKRYMERVFGEQGEFHHMGVLLVSRDPDGEPIPDGGYGMAPVVGAPNTEVLAQTLKEVGAQMGAFGCLVLSEVWMASIRGETAAADYLAGRKGASQHPERVEALMLLADMGGVREAWQALITRDAAGKGHPGEWVKLSAEIEGRLVGLLPHLN